LTAGTDEEHRTIKIADFGLAKMGEPPLVTQLKQTVHAETMLTSMVGTPQYLAPEVVMQTADSRGYENVVDSWSVGIITYRCVRKDT
jgi:serine/threonine/tyrosine protein kinase RAD53